MCDYTLPVWVSFACAYRILLRRSGLVYDFVRRLVRIRIEWNWFVSCPFVSTSQQLGVHSSLSVRQRVWWQLYVYDVIVFPPCCNCRPSRLDIPAAHDNKNWTNYPVSAFLLWFFSGFLFDIPLRILLQVYVCDFVIFSRLLMQHFMPDHS